MISMHTISIFQANSLNHAGKLNWLSLNFKEVKVSCHKLLCVKRSIA